MRVGLGEEMERGGQVSREGVEMDEVAEEVGPGSEARGEKVHMEREKGEEVARWGREVAMWWRMVE